MTRANAKITLRRLVEQYTKRKYGSRRANVIYAHMLDNPITVLDTRRREQDRLSTEMVIGELLHSGLEKILGEVKEACRTVPVSPVNPYTTALSFIKNGAVTVCGTADAVIDNEGDKIVIELKTTADSKLLLRPRSEWVTRARLYAWLYKATTAQLLVVYRVTGKEWTHVLPPYTDNEVRAILEAWLEARYPRRVLLHTT